MQNIVYSKKIPAPCVNLAEIRRYAGFAKGYEEGDELIKSCLEEILSGLVYKVSYCRLPLASCSDVLDLGFMKTKSSDLKKNLRNCDEFVLFAATIGLEIDRLITKYSHISPVRALIFQAIGAERIEALADAFNLEIKIMAEKEGKKTSPRFSPGYGDFPLDAQKNIFSVLDCPRKIGLTLNESLIMSPSKSVTALIGMGKCVVSSPEENPCLLCNKKNCEFGRKI